MTEKYWDGENWLRVKKNNYIKMYFLNEKIHRKDGSAAIFYYNGNIEKEIYIINDKLHRKNGPAVIEYHDNGFTEKYYQNDKLYREDGPAFIFYNNDGTISKQFFFNGVEFDPENLSFELPFDTEEKKLYFKLKYGDNNA